MSAAFYTTNNDIKLHTDSHGRQQGARGHLPLEFEKTREKLSTFLRVGGFATPALEKFLQAPMLIRINDIKHILIHHNNSDNTSVPSSSTLEFHHNKSDKPTPASNAQALPTIPTISLSPSHGCCLQLPAKPNTSPTVPPSSTYTCIKRSVLPQVSNIT